MPNLSKAQNRFMQAAASSPEMAKEARHPSEGSQRVCKRN
jgi:hypothetical protein